MSDGSAAASAQAKNSCKAQKGDSKSKNVGRKKVKAGGTDMMSSAEAAPKAPDIPECAVCLQSCVHPVELPCSHVFCFLCMKGASTQYRRCALCRQEIPIDFFTSPKLLEEEEEEEEEEGNEEQYTWFYEGRNGWWQYDERTDAELEESYRANKRSFELLIAGFLYMIDLDSMLQYRRSDPSRRRRIKRDLISAPKKGIAGLKIKVKREEETREREVVDGAEELKENAGAVGGDGGGGAPAPIQNNNGTAKTVATHAQDETVPSQEQRETSDESGRGTDTSTPDANHSSGAANETVYEVVRRAPHRTAENSPPSYRYATPSLGDDSPPSYSMPQRPRRRPLNEPPPTATSQTPVANVSPLISNTSTTSLSLSVHHQRTHSAPETRASSRPRCPAPPAPPQRAPPSRPDQAQGPTSSSSSEEVDRVIGGVQSHLVISVDATNTSSSSARRRQVHRHVHEV